MSRASIVLGFSVLLWLTPGAGAQDRRTTEILSYSCGSEFGRREITLFANGTLRLREGPWEDQKLYLDELAPEAVKENLRLLRGVDLERVTTRIRLPSEDGLTGRWIERCLLRLKLPEMAEPVEYEHSSFDIPPLAISRLIHVAEELAQYARPADREGGGVPEGYEPRFGDVLITAEGYRFKVLRLTSDENGVELEGIDQPLRIYVALSEISQSFVALEENQDGSFWWNQ